MCIDNLRCNCGNLVKKETKEITVPALGISKFIVDVIGCPVCKIVLEINPIQAEGDIL